MTIYERIGDEIVSYNIDRDTAKLSALSFDKLVNMNTNQVGKYSILIKKRPTEQARFVYPLFEKAFGKELRTIEEQEKIKSRL